MVEALHNNGTETGKFRSQVLEVKDVSFSSPERLLFTDVNLTAKRGENIALIGKSGVGKSTLIKIVLGSVLPDTGTVSIPAGVRVSYVPQDLSDYDIDEDTTVKQLFYAARGLDVLDGKKTELEQKMVDPEQSDQMEAIFEEYGAVCEQFEKMGGYSADAEMDKILAGLKLDQETSGHIIHDTRLNQVSSGQRTRLLIGQALFANSDLLVMDDPTSHLDVASVDWLAKYLKSSKQAAIVATNNVPFIEACMNKVVEITDFGRVLSFEGAYKAYSEKRDRLLEAERMAAKTVKDEHDRIEVTYNDFKSRQVFRRSADMAQVGRALQSRMRRLDDLYESLPGSKQVDREERVKPLVFRSAIRSGDDVLTISGVTKKYEDFTALDLRRLTFSLRRGQTLMLSGENGSGKSTLMRMIVSAIQDDSFNPDTGSIKVGASIKAGYYSPDNIGVSRQGNILEEVRMATRQGNESEAVGALMYWGIPKVSIRTKMLEQLSAGERKQVSFAKLMVHQPNLLLLDEPTDYLKPEIVVRLIDALHGYDGTLVLVSHDREFTDSLKINFELKLPEGKLVAKDND